MVVETDDAHLVTAARAGDLEAFGELVRRNWTRVYRVALRMLGNPEEAEDVTQDAFVQAWQALPGFRGESAFATWLYRIATNRSLNLIRDRQASKPLDETHEAPASRPNHIAEERAAVEALKLAVTRLTPEQCAPFVLREFEALSYEEIAAVLEITVPAVKGRIHRARLELLHELRSWR